ncbi:MAG: APC family permease [Phycisphaerales bacterium]
MAGTGADQSGSLRRDLGVPGATMMGLGSVVGTGIFVSIGVATGVAGPSVILAIVIAAGLAVCNALSSAQLAASHPTSGGTYEYGYAYLRPWLGFSAGWMFLCAKSASAATAAIGFACYSFAAIGVSHTFWQRALALIAVITMLGLILGGIRRSSVVNSIIVSLTMIALATFVIAGLPVVFRKGSDLFTPFFESPSGDGRSPFIRMLEASALMFVAYTGYGRVATLGEEVRDPRRTIPLAIIATLFASMCLYVGVGVIGIGAGGASVFHSSGIELDAPLTEAARGFGVPGVTAVISIGAITAMLGVLLNLILGLSRVALAMGRRGDLPRWVSKVNSSGTSPTHAVLLVGVVVLALTSIGSIRLAWSFSAFTVLIYYAVTNLAAIRMPKDQRLYHPAIPWIGLIGCLSLAFWVETRVWVVGVAVLIVGLGARWLMQARLNKRS